MIINNKDNIDEAGLVIDKKDGAYPKNGQILIMAGGAGSGKSFILDKLILFDGKKFNPDITLEMLVIMGKKWPNNSLCRKFKEFSGLNLGEINIKNSDQLNELYNFISRFRLNREKEACFFKAIQNSKIKPNVIFDITMQDLDRAYYISKYASMSGYDKSNINIVWVLNDIDIALKQNAARDRTVDSDILKYTHINVAYSMNDIIKNSEKWQEIIDGDIWIVFNKKGIDVKTISSTVKKDNGEDKVNVNIDPNADKPYFAINMKEKGKKAKQWSELNKEILDKISDYVPPEAAHLFKK